MFCRGQVICSIKIILRITDFAWRTGGVHNHGTAAAAGFRTAVKVMLARRNLSLAHDVPLSISQWTGDVFTDLLLKVRNLCNELSGFFQLVDGLLNDPGQVLPTFRVHRVCTLQTLPGYFKFSEEPDSYEHGSKK